MHDIWYIVQYTGEKQKPPQKRSWKLTAAKQVMIVKDSSHLTFPLICNPPALLSRPCFILHIHPGPPPLRNSWCVTGNTISHFFPKALQLLLLNPSFLPPMLIQATFEHLDWKFSIRSVVYSFVSFNHSYSGLSSKPRKDKEKALFFSVGGLQ